jgi:phthiocerol/phenolphthiocerol synthesis type-I polyketide synthase E
MSSDAASWAPDEYDSPFVAVIGMAGRFPGAADLGKFWDNLVTGVESITRTPAPDNSYVQANGILAGTDEFDAAFFGYSPNEALIIDPQQRLFLECAWEALEDAGHDPQSFPGAIGVYGGSSESAYPAALRACRAKLSAIRAWHELRLGTGLDFLTTRVAYKLGLNGPAVTVQTACSTSLVAVHLAAQALLAGDCDMALAGGITAHLWMDYDPPREAGYLAPDGHCRAFDARADGTVFSDGVGVVVLRRLTDALTDGDEIRAVLRGWAANNDGQDKIGFTAPSVDAQARVIRAAHLAAEVAPETISYVEAHGTGTPIGDPIEIAALTRAFRWGTDRTGFCRIGSVKTNIGHADAAAGIAGFIKTVLAIEHGMLPASLHFQRPNPEIDFEQSPFFVNHQLCRWERGPDSPRRAGVSSFGAGGTNVHVVLEEAPDRVPSDPGRPWQLIVLSARDEGVLELATARLADHLHQHPEVPLPDVAWTLQTGRRGLRCRRFAVCTDTEDAAGALDRTEVGRLQTSRVDGDGRAVFLFPGQGGQHVGMSRDLYEHEPEFRARIDECCELLAADIGLDLRAVLYPPAHDATAATVAEKHLERVSVGQPAIFAVEYALAKLLLRWGVAPVAVAGHSLGSYAAACIAEMVSLPDALRLVVRRAQLLESLPRGAMLAVSLPEAELRSFLDDGLAIAVINGPAQCVAAGRSEVVHGLERRLADAGVHARRLRTIGAGHCDHVGPIVAPFADHVRSVTWKPPTIPFMSDTTGNWASPGELTEPAYWIRHLREPVRFGEVLSSLLGDPRLSLLEVGPGRTLVTLAKQHPAFMRSSRAIPTMPHPADPEPELATLLTAVGRLWLSGAAVSWTGVHEGQPRRRVRLPTYPFERLRYSVGPPPQHDAQAPDPAKAGSLLVAAPASGGSPVRTQPKRDAAVLTDTQRCLVEAFEAILGGSVGIGDDFFDLGGDSLVATRLVSLVRDRLGAQIRVRDVFEARTVVQLAAVVERHAAR